MEEERKVNTEMYSFLMESAIIIIIAIEIIVVLILRLLQIFRRKSIKEEIKKREQRTSALNKEVSYKKFLDISKRTSSLNSPVRKKGDFFDFLSENISSDSSLIENSIFLIDNEEYYE